MKKLTVILSVFSVISFANSLDMNNLYCKNLKLTSSSTLSDVQNNCTVKKQSQSSGMFEVEFINDATKKKVKCDFAEDQPTSLLNGCRSVGWF